MVIFFFIRKNMLISIEINHSHLGVVNYKTLMDFSSVLNLSDGDSDCVYIQHYSKQNISQL